MKAGWQTKTLGDLFDITSSKRVFESDWKKEGVPFYRAREIVKLAKHGFVENELFISEEMFNQYSAKYGIPAEGDIMVTGVGTLGVCYVVQKSDKFYFKDGNIIWLKKKTEANSRFVEYAFKSDVLRKQIDDSVGATVGTYTIIKAKNTLIPVPPLPEQQRIVGILDEAFDGIATAEANAEKNLQNARALFESYLQSVFTKRGEGWVEKSLKDVCQIRPPKNEAKLRLNSSDMVSFAPMENLGINQKYLHPTAKRNLDEVAGSYTYFGNGDVLLAKITPCFENGKLGIAKDLVNGIGFGSSEYIVFRPDSSLNNEFLYYFLSRQSFRDEGAQQMLGAVGQKRVSKEFIENYPISVPMISKQKHIVSQLDTLLKETQHLETIYQRKFEELDALKLSLLHQVFSGELKS